ncbi:HutD/Ves family protein [Devosia sp. SL43]|uniref:HutD/Ves family protein n=1 Tax=Devosia sp. SL43 TaxID=2806348 RepID=UPI001F2769EA|nr:HutD family protein [Devosia sp. SL43]UJW84875.1 HutD family protein [Devosia sp. SL43]
MQIIRSQDHKIVPWRNGGGVTRDVSSYHDDAQGQDFLWRLSIATVSQSGPFSHFLGIDRTIAVMAGDGFSMQVEDQRVALDRATAPYSFAGEAEVCATVTAGPTTDLNIMTRRGVFAHTMTRLLIDRPTSLPILAPLTIIVFNGACRVTVGSVAEQMEILDALVVSKNEVPIALSPPPRPPSFISSASPAHSDHTATCGYRV